MSKLILCPDCGKLLSPRFPLHDCKPVNLAAQTLGRLARGKPKTYSAEQIALRTKRLELARLKRWQGHVKK